MWQHKFSMPVMLTVWRRESSSRLHTVSITGSEKKIRRCLKCCPPDRRQSVHLRQTLFTLWSSPRTVKVSRRMLCLSSSRLHSCNWIMLLQSRNQCRLFMVADVTILWSFVQTFSNSRLLSQSFKRFSWKFQVQHEQRPISVLSAQFVSCLNFCILRSCFCNLQLCLYV